MMDLSEPKAESFHGALLVGICRLIVEASEGKYEAVVEGGACIYAAGDDQEVLRLRIQGDRLGVIFWEPLLDEPSHQMIWWPVYDLVLPLADPGMLDLVLEETRSHLAALQAGTHEEWVAERKGSPGPGCEVLFRKALGQ